MSRPRGRKDPHARRQCTICHAELYPDEPYSACQDCRPILERLDTRGGWTRALPAPELAAREARIEGHAQRLVGEALGNARH